LEPIGEKSHFFGEDLDTFTTYYLQEKKVISCISFTKSC
jgi:hypothetical protein